MRIAQTRRESKPGLQCAAGLLLGVTVGWMGVLGGFTLPLDAADSVRQLPANAEIRFAGTSTLHDFGGHLPAQPFLLTISNDTWSASTAVWTGLMVTENVKRDRKMHEMLGTNDHPRIRGTVVGAPIPGPAGTNVTLLLKIRDTSQNLNVRIDKWRESADAIRFHAEWELSVKRFGLKPPSVAGVIRVGDTVKLEADVTATNSVPEPPAATATSP